MPAAHCPIAGGPTAAAGTSSPPCGCSADGAVTHRDPAPDNGAPRRAAAATAVAHPQSRRRWRRSTEALVEPCRDNDYAPARATTESFLGVASADARGGRRRRSLARRATARHVLPVPEFLDLMHAAAPARADHRLERRPPIRSSGGPTPARDYTREGLTGLGENDQERWFLDPRLDDKFQLPDVFFTKDRKAFDKGHIVRRDDVAWGETYEQLRRANGDTYHVTNCSPQMAGFNRSNDGNDNWGDLENHVLSERGQGAACAVRRAGARPRRHGVRRRRRRGVRSYARRSQRVLEGRRRPVEDGIAAYRLRAGAGSVQVEFESRAAEFVPHMYPLADIQEMAGVRFSRRSCSTPTSTRRCAAPRCRSTPVRAASGESGNAGSSGNPGIQ